MKKRILFSLVLSMLLVITSFTAVSADTSENPEIDLLDDGSYYETIIEEDTPQFALFATTSKKSGSKTVYYKNSSGTTLWYVKVSGSFSYNGSSSSCTSSTVTASAPGSNWSIKSKTASKSGNTAYASATAVKKTAGVTTQTITRNVSLTCSKSGALS